MNWKQHLRIGILSSGSFAILMAIFFGWFDYKFLTLLELGVVIFFSGLVPDLDHQSGKLHQWLIGLGLTMALIGFGLTYFDSTLINNQSLIILGVVIASSTFFVGKFSRHRGLWHSIPACIVYGIIIGFATMNSQIGLIAFVGCYSHLVADNVPFKMK